MNDEEKRKEWEEMDPQVKEFCKKNVHRCCQEATMKVSIELLCHLYNDLSERVDKLEKKDNDEEKIKKAIEIAVQYGGFYGDHHKDWVIDQMVRTLAGDKYDAIVAEACYGEAGPDTYEWNTGIAP